MTDHDQVVEQERAGKLLIGVDRAFARRFYTDVALKTIEERTGEAPYFEKLVVMGAFIGEHLALLGAAVLAVLVTGWWSILLIPAGLIGWFAFSSASSIGNARIGGITFVLAATIAATVFADPSGRRAWFVAAMYIGSLWLARLLYTSSTTFLRLFVLRNAKGFDWLRDRLSLRAVE